jgi:hypothetical protein
MSKSPYRRNKHSKRSGIRTSGPSFAVIIGKKKGKCFTEMVCVSLSSCHLLVLTHYMITKSTGYKVYTGVSKNSLLMEKCPFEGLSVCLCVAQLPMLAIASG